MTTVWPISAEIAFFTSAANYAKLIDNRPTRRLHELEVSIKDENKPMFVLSMRQRKQLEVNTVVYRDNPKKFYSFSFFRNFYYLICLLRTKSHLFNSLPHLLSSVMQWCHHIDRAALCKWAIESVYRIQHALSRKGIDIAYLVLTSASAPPLHL